MLLLGWTTTETLADARKLAQGLVEASLAACVQIEGPIESHYRWDGQVTSSEEFRLLVKFTKTMANGAEAYVMRHHPYDTPEWVVVESAHVAEKYLSWAEQPPST